ncbi:MAG: hypothetical protein ACOCTQ_01830 [Planctomycetota bacterium]
MPAVKIIFFQITIACVALTLLWQTRLVRWEGHRLDEMQARTSNIETQIQRCEAHISKLESPQRIMKLVQQLNLNLVHRTTGTKVSPSEQHPFLVENNDINRTEKTRN